MCSFYSEFLRLLSRVIFSKEKCNINVAKPGSLLTPFSFKYFLSQQMQALFKIGKGTPPTVPDSLSRDARDFILSCIQVNPNDRPTAAQLLDHPFVKRPLPTTSGSASPYISGPRS